MKISTDPNQDPVLFFKRIFKDLNRALFVLSPYDSKTISQYKLKIWAIKTIFSHLSHYIGMCRSCSVPTKHTLISYVFSINQTFIHVFFFPHFISELSAESSSRRCFLLMLPFQKCITILNNQPRLFSKSTLFIYLGSVKGNVFKKFKHKTPHKCITSARKE